MLSSKPLLRLDSQYRHEVLYNLPLPIIILNDDGQVSEFNKQAKELFDHIDIGKPIAFIICNNEVLEAIQQVNRGEEGDRLRGLDGGADDYVTKPFSPAELLARVRAIIRRQTCGYDAKLTGGDIELDLEQKRVKRDGTSIHLGPTEFRLLEYFMRNQGRVYSRDQLLDSVWGDGVYVGMRAVDVHTRRLRKAINITGGPDMIRTVRSMGYSFEARY